ncbi:hypothetical protein TNCV_3153461 [Trichonephila clavipes]|nr:hypothetical protein TNCV_3153461 [Trichonephila clavipes]
MGLFAAGQESARVMQRHLEQLGDHCCGLRRHYSLESASTVFHQMAELDTRVEPRYPFRRVSVLRHDDCIRA